MIQKHFCADTVELTAAWHSLRATERCLNIVAAKKKIREFEMNFEKEHGYTVRCSFCTLTANNSFSLRGMLIFHVSAEHTCMCLTDLSDRAFLFRCRL